MVKIHIRALVGKIAVNEEPAQLESGDSNCTWERRREGHRKSTCPHFQVLHLKGLLLFLLCSFSSFFFVFVFIVVFCKPTKSSSACLLDQTYCSVTLPAIPMVGN